MIDFSDLPVWPWRLLRGATERAWPTSRVVTGGASLSNLTQVGSTSGGGRWEAELAGIDLRTPDEIRCARAWAAYLDGGLRLCVVPIFDLGQAPRPRAGGALALPGSPAPETDYFSQEAGFGAPLMEARTVAPGVLRATTLRIAVDVGTRLVGGEHLSINHEGWGWRMYRVGRVSPVADQPTMVDAQITPPLREAVDADTPVELDVPRCVMRLDPSRASDFEAAIEGNRLATVTAAFIEAFG